MSWLPPALAKEEHRHQSPLLCRLHASCEHLRALPGLGTTPARGCTGTRRFPSVPKLAKAIQSVAARDLGSVCLVLYIRKAGRLPQHWADRNNLRTGPAIHLGLVLPVRTHGDVWRSLKHVDHLRSLIMHQSSLRCKYGICPSSEKTETSLSP